MSTSTYSTPHEHDQHQPQSGALGVPAVYGTRDAAAYLGVAMATLRTWRHRRRGPKSFRMGGRIVYRRSALDAYIDACESADSRSNAELDPLNRDPEIKAGRMAQREVAREAA
jgi:predicted DNA-binding transcriptional regulator AlpA